MAGYWYSLDSEADCKYARRFNEGAAPIFAALPATAAPALFATAYQCLKAVRDDLCNQLARDMFHFSAQQGGHRCVEASFQEATRRLTQVSLLTPQPEAPSPPPEPPPRPQPLTDEEQLAFVERWIRENAQQTVFGGGQKEESNDTGTPGA